MGHPEPPRYEVQPRVDEQDVHGGLDRPARRCGEALVRRHAREGVAGVPEPRRRREEITIRQLLSHTSGLGDYFTDEYERTSKERLRAIKDYLPLFVNKPLLFEPGTKSRYSNAGFMVLGGVVQRVSGQDYFDYVRAHVYAPAGMKDTDAYELDHDPQNLAIGYTPDRDDPNEPLVPGKLRNNLYMHVVKGGPAGGGFSTVGDLIAFGDALLHGKLLPSAQVATLTTTHGAPEPKSYGYGFALRSIDGQREFGHTGDSRGSTRSSRSFPIRGCTSRRWGTSIRRRRSACVRGRRRCLRT